MITYQVSVEDGASEMVRGLIRALSEEGRRDLNEVGGRTAVNAARDFHDAFDAAGGWRGKRSFGNGRSDFGAAVAAGWHFDGADGSGATIANNAEHYGFKVRGGTITPKRVKFLTIPLTREARGRRARTYEEDFGKRLFIPKGTSVLAEKKEKGKGFKAIYALLRSVTQPPWPDALPREELVSETFVEGFMAGLADSVEGFE